MEKLNKKAFRCIILIVLVCSIGVVSCSENTPVEIKNIEYCLCPDGKGTSIKGIFSNWFECSDEKGNNPVKCSGVSGNTLTVDDFTEPGIRFFRNGNLSSTIYCVAYTGLPLVEIKTEQEDALSNHDTYTSATIRITNTDGTVEENTITIKGRGNYSWTLPKKGYNIKFDKKTEVLGMKKGKKWCLISNYDDSSFMRNSISSYLGKEVFSDGTWEPSYVNVDVILNGQFCGNYTVAEAIKIDKQRLNITSMEDSKTIEEGGIILEVDFRQDATHYFTTSLKHSVSLYDPDYDDENADAVIKFIKDKVDSFELNILQNENISKLSKEKLEEYIDLKSFIRWFTIEELTHNFDANLTTSVFLYYNGENKKLYMGPDWDFDHSMGNLKRKVAGIECSSTTGFWTTTPPLEFDNSWFKFLLENDVFRAAVLSELNNEKTQKTNKINTFIDETEKKLKVSATLDYIVWPNTRYFDEVIFTKDFEASVKSLKEWLNERYDNFITEIKQLDSTAN